MIPPEVVAEVLACAIASCAPAPLVREALAQLDGVLPSRAGPRGGAFGAAQPQAAEKLDRVLGLAVGKAAQAMARGAGAVEHGLCIAPADDGEPLPRGWRRIIAGHPFADERSVAAGEAALALVDAARGSDVVLALISGGASALLEVPRTPLAELREVTSALTAAGAPIAELNAVRSALSRVKGGQLTASCAARVVTLAISDVLGDPLEVIGSGPTVVAPEVVARAREVLARYGIASPAIAAALDEPRAVPARIGDIATVIAPMSRFSRSFADLLGAAWIEAPFAGDVEVVAADLVARSGTVVAWGEPTLSLPADRGEGGRMQHLALLLAKALRGTDRCALCLGSDGVDGPPPRARPAPAGAAIDGETWDEILAAGLDPDRALARRDAGTALAAVDALVVTGPTGINHADLVVVG